MKTLEQILEGVTAGGKWEEDGGELIEHNQRAIADFQRQSDAAYAAWATRHAPALIRALNLMITAPDSAEAMRVARNAMAEALKD